MVDSIWEMCDVPRGTGTRDGNGAGSLREAGKEGAGDRIPMGRKPGKTRNKCCHIAQFFAIEKAHQS